MKFVVALLIGVLAVTRAVEPEAVAKADVAPAKIRLNGDLLKKVFNARDQEVFKALKDT